MCKNDGESTGLCKKESKEEEVDTTVLTLPLVHSEAKETANETIMQLYGDCEQTKDLQELLDELYRQLYISLRWTGDDKT